MLRMRATAVVVDAAQIRGSEDFAAWAASSLVPPKWRNVRLPEIARAIDGENLGLSTSEPCLFLLFGKSYAAGFARGFSAPKVTEDQTNGKAMDVTRRNSQRLKMLDAVADQKGDPRSAKIVRDWKRRKALARQFRRVLPGKPYRVNRIFLRKPRKKSREDQGTDAPR